MKTFHSPLIAIALAVAAGSLPAGAAANSATHEALYDEGIELTSQWAAALAKTKTPAEAKTAVADASALLPKLEDLAKRMKQAGTPSSAFLEEMDRKHGTTRKANQAAIQSFLLNFTLNPGVLKEITPLLGEMSGKTGMTKIFGSWGLESSVAY